MAVYVDCTKTLVAVLPMTVAVAVLPMTVTVAVPETNVRDAVTRVLPIEMVQADVFSDADRVTSVRTDPVVTPDRTSAVATEETTTAVAVDSTRMPVVVALAKTAVAVSNGTSIRYHAVPSLAMAQSELAVPVIGKKRLVADAVFGVCV